MLMQHRLHLLVGGCENREMSGGSWVLLAYRLPREPSTARVNLWRKLRRLGVGQIVDGLVALPDDARNREQLGWLVDEVVDAGGEASLWIGRPASARHERALAGEMAAAVADEYGAVIGEARAARQEPTVARRRILARLSRELRRIEARDYFGPPERERARAAVERLGAVAKADDMAVRR